MKKIILLLILALVVTGCTAEYTLTFEDDVFKEHIVIYEEKNSIGTNIFGINSLKENPDLAKIDDDHSYKYNISSDDKNNILTLDYTYDDVSIEKSQIFDCFRYKNFIDGDDYYYVSLETDMVCENLKDATITFKTDKKVLDDNASEKDVSQGIYKWNNFVGGKIYFQVSKTQKIDSSNVEDVDFIPWYIKIIIVLVFAVVIFFIYRKVKRDYL